MTRETCISFYIGDTVLHQSRKNNPMMHKNQSQSADTVALASKLVMAYVSNNHMPATELPALISTVHAALNGIASGTATGGASVSKKEVAFPTPAEIRKSIRPDGLVSFIDGKPYKTLKRHLTGHGLGPQSYRKRFGLPADYPMTAASYSEKRSALARELGLGRPGRMAA
ncbi:MucR family transcriptional regulator [Methylobacterium sp. WL93]|uniref:MucR family transcriptional regulator n=1 Tax=unclassified Methylobacterium TaxID=2615210 RepID=UPI0032B2ED1F